MTTLEQATLVSRAIQTFEYLSEYGIIEDDDSIPSTLVVQSWCDLKRLMAMYAAQGVCVKDIDIGAYS